MTTIAYRDGVIAADTLACSGNLADLFVAKIAARAGVLAGATGTSAMCMAFRDWFRRGMVGDPPSPVNPADKDDGYTGVIFPGANVVLMWNDAGWLKAEAPYYAAGSGREIALGALAVGASAEEAVRAASRHDTHTGGEITVLRR